MNIVFLDYDGVVNTLIFDGKVYRIENIPLEFKPTKELANSISNVLSDREKWKKIAEKLVDIVALNTVPKEECKQCIIDWARNEVINDK